MNPNAQGTVPLPKPRVGRAAPSPGLHPTNDAPSRPGSFSNPRSVRPCRQAPADGGFEGAWWHHCSPCSSGEASSAHYR